MQTPATFVIKEASGRIVRGNIHGAGGPLTDRETLPKLISRATAGRSLGRVYEPAPGHVRAYLSGAGADMCEGMIDLRGAEVIQ